MTCFTPRKQSKLASAPIRIRKESVTDNVGAGRYTIGTVYLHP